MRDACPRGHPNSFNFMQFLGEFVKIVCSRPSPGEFTSPPGENPGSVTAIGTNSFVMDGNLRSFTCFSASLRSGYS